MKETLNIIKNDPWLEPYADAIIGRHQYALNKEAELTNKGKQTLSDFASGYLYFGLHRTPKGWTFREWAPNATHIYMVGTFNNWEEKAAYKLKKTEKWYNGEKKFLLLRSCLFNYLCEQNRISNVMLIVKLVKTRLTML